jgi:hypothetical protein
VLVEDPLSLQIGKVLFSKDFVYRIVITGLNMILSTSTTLKNQVAKNNFEKKYIFYSQYIYLGSHDRVHKAAVTAMKGTDNFEDILKSNNDSSLGRGNRLKKKKNFDLPDPIEISRKKRKLSHRCELEKVTEKSMDGDIEHLDVNKANLNKSENSLEEQQAEASNFGYPRLERDWDENSSNSIDRGGMLSCFMYLLKINLIETFLNTGSTTPLNSSGLFDPISPTTDVFVDLSLDRVNTLQDMNDKFQRQRIMHKSFTDTDQTVVA